MATKVALRLWLGLDALLTGYIFYRLVTDRDSLAALALAACSYGLGSSLAAHFYRTYYHPK